ncbi:helix-turn-helix domain-containing protein [Streptomyces sp. NPDC008196]|jgi:excisionase family DNA binding protein|uniref:helix-turn-helix domain-containing protein n=1 Tax=Streptomyces sp. NPDC008196 TaxID=3364819 RepID=UPI0036E8B5D6
MQTQTEIDGEWLTVREVAEHFRVSERTVNRWALSGLLRVRRIGPTGRLIRIHRAVLDEHDLPAAA